MDVRVLKDFVAEVLTTCRYDDVGITLDLYELALAAAAELGMTTEEIEEITGEYI